MTYMEVLFKTQVIKGNSRGNHFPATNWDLKMSTICSAEKNTEANPYSYFLKHIFKCN